MIPMTDADVQQVRDAMRLKANGGGGGKQGTPYTPAQMKAAATPGQPYHHVEEQKKKREGMSRDERLGLR